MSEASVVVVGGRAAVLSSLRSLRVVLPSGEAYWTVVDEEYRVVAAADAFLRDLRFGADRTESTTKLYAGELALFLGWADGSGRDLERAARELSRFVLLLRTTPITRRGRGYGRPRSAGRINHVLAVVREFVKHRVAHGRLDARVLAALYEVGDDRFLPAELRAEDGGLRYRVRPRHKLRAERPGRERAARQEEWEALLLAASCWRDRFLLVLLWFSGLRIGEALGLRRSDLHLMESASVLGCETSGAHLHVVPRENVNGARAKGRRERVVPLAHHVLSPTSSGCVWSAARRGMSGRSPRGASATAAIDRRSTVVRAPRPTSPGMSAGRRRGRARALGCAGWPATRWPAAATGSAASTCVIGAGRAVRPARPSRHGAMRSASRCPARATSTSPR
ncbi:MAG: tyrosine-type recombinase/integrase [Solirubrobacterales bacterium]